MQKEALKATINRIYGIVVSNNQTWEKIVEEKRTTKDIRKEYLYPLVLLSVVSALLFCSISSSKGIETGLLEGITTFISELGAYFLANMLCFRYLKRYRPELASPSKTETIVCYSYIIILLVDILVNILPTLFFLRVLSLFIAYVLWNGCRAMWQLKEEERASIVLVFTVLILSSFALIRLLLCNMIS